MTNITVHIKYNFEYFDEIKQYLQNNDIEYELLNPNAKSFKFKGNKTQYNNFLKFIADNKYDIKTITNLNSLEPRCVGLKLLSNLLPIATNGTFTPRQLATVYNLNGNINLNNSRIAIISLGGGYRQSDMNTYWSFLGLTQNPILTDISIDGATNTPGLDSGSVETVLDIQVAGGLNYNSNIDIYFAPNNFTSFYNAIFSAVYNSNKYDTISISWGLAESEWGADNINLFNELFEDAANVLNVTICVASGDRGSSDGLSGLNVDYPAGSPWILSCGGTTLICPDLNYSSSSTSETVWNNSSGATGGGFSAFLSISSWQLPIVITNYPLQVKRSVPDISAVADPNTGYIIYLFGKYYTVGGTSAVAPLLAGYIASFKKGFIIQKLYNSYLFSKTITHDILIGNNSNVNTMQTCADCYISNDSIKWKALPSYDACTGMGTPNGTVLTPIIQSY